MSDPTPLIKANKAFETSKNESDSSDTDSDIEAAAHVYSAPKPQSQQPLIFSAAPANATPSYGYKSILKESLTIPDHDSLCLLVVQTCSPFYCCNCCPGWKVNEGQGLDKETLISRLQHQVLNKLKAGGIESFTVEIYGGSNNAVSRFNNKEALINFMTDELGYQDPTLPLNFAPTQNPPATASCTRS